MFHAKMKNADMFAMLSQATEVSDCSVDASLLS
jgi:hypothetical protein